MTTPPTNFAGKMLLWVIWIAMMMALPCYKIILGHGDRVDTHARPVDLFVLGLFAVPLLMCTVIRWLVIPKLNNPMAILTPFIAGVALAESMTFYGIFLVPEFSSIFFYASVFAMAQFVPVYGTNEKPAK